MLSLFFFQVIKLVAEQAFGIEKVFFMWYAFWQAEFSSIKAMPDY